MTSKNFTVYCHTNKTNGKKYVGITSQKPEHRWNNGKGYKASTRFYSAIKCYGWEMFSHEILYTGLTEKQAIDVEKRLIKQWCLTDKRYGYNMTPGGEHHTYFGRRVSEDTRKKISQSHKGIKPSSETLKKLRDAHLNKGGKPVQMFKNGELIAVFKTAAEAGRTLKTSSAHITSCCKNKRKTAAGYTWKYI